VKQIIFNDTKIAVAHSMKQLYSYNNTLTKREYDKKMEQLDATISAKARHSMPVSYDGLMTELGLQSPQITSNKAKAQNLLAVPASSFGGEHRTGGRRN
jgi:hypothetical protein